MFRQPSFTLVPSALIFELNCKTLNGPELISQQVKEQEDDSFDVDFAVSLQSLYPWKCKITEEKQNGSELKVIHTWCQEYNRGDNQGADNEDNK